MTEDGQPCCEHCKHYYQHYIYKRLTLRKIFYGHCIYMHGNCYDAKVCERYEYEENEKEEFDKSLKEYLSLTLKKLTEISKILKEKDS